MVYLIWFGKVHRGKSDNLEKQLAKRQQEITVINKFERGSKKDFKEVVNELKLALAERKVKVESNS